MSTHSRFVRVAIAAVAAASMTAVAACSGGSAEETDRTFTVLQYEDPNSAQGQGWALAMELFQEMHPDVTIDYQTTSFDAMRQNATITLGGNDVPDVVEFNKGNADGGQLASQGLLLPLTDEVAARGWDEVITGSMASFAQYDENGNAGAGEWYGIPNIGEYVTLYYNADIFAEAGIEVPQSLDELEAAMVALQDAGHTPIASSASTSQGFNQMWIWYSLVSALADREQIDDFMFLREDVDFSSGPWAEGTSIFEEWTEAGYLGADLGGLSYEQAQVSFLGGEAAMYMWNQGAFDRIRTDADFEWGYFTMPGAQHVMGSSGHLWGIPANAENVDLAYDWIDITLSDEVQNLIGENGGLPLAGDTSQISDDLVREYTAGFDQLAVEDRLSFYPDYPVPGFLDFIQTHMQTISNGNETADEYLAALQEFYDDGREFTSGG
ncbi:ABC transporter substrate-binding protein [Ruania halotolerans]|uniref:ABC transporter substrate-binding protein n=1 Tax=Ruania halotolerans TaxID=2897773 RepID=UPI001E5B48AD|nr:extracellular solute-binding protein [Ruania halotolerans]UFU06357.1 extracellular solute-binding protein [Ruania halotolerans]